MPENRIHPETIDPYTSPEEALEGLRETLPEFLKEIEEDFKELERLGKFANGMEDIMKYIALYQFLKIKIKDYVAGEWILNISNGVSKERAKMIMKGSLNNFLKRLAVVIGKVE